MCQVLSLQIGLSFIVFNVLDVGKAAVNKEDCLDRLLLHDIAP